MSGSRRELRNGRVTEAPILFHSHDDLMRILGRNYLKRLVYPHIVRDGFKSVLPLVLQTEDERLGRRYTVIVKDGDAGICTFAPVAPHEFVTYGRYFTFNNDPPAKSLLQVLEGFVPNRVITVDESLPLSLYRTLSTELDLIVSRRDEISGRRSGDDEAIYHHTLSRADVANRASTGMNRFREAAIKVTANYRNGGELASLLHNVADPGFPLLDSLMEKRDLTTMLVTSPFQIEDLSGLPSDWLETASAMLLVVKGDPSLHLLVPAAGMLPGAKMRGEFKSLGEAVRQLTQASSKDQQVATAQNIAIPTEGQFAVEHVHADLRLARALGKEPLSLLDASPTIYKWQELRAASQLPFYVLAANSARHALERTIEYAEERLRQGELQLGKHDEVRESELARAFNAFLGAYAIELGLSGFIRPYFCIIHPGERTLVPAAPSEYVLTRDNKTIKFDVGTQVLDSGGQVRGCSDIARTVCNVPVVKRFHEMLRLLLLERVIPAIRPGVTGANVHHTAVQALAEHDELFRSWGVLPANRSALDYARDCGHVINRQTITTIYFTPDCDVPIEAGMSGCVEFVWAVSDMVVAVEEAYIVTDDGALPITA